MYEIDEGEQKIGVLGWVVNRLVDVLTSPVAAARAAVATGAWVKSKHHMYLTRGSVGAYALFLPIRRRIKKKKKEVNRLTVYQCKRY